MAAQGKKDVGKMTEDALRELREPSDFSITFKERIQMKNIPLFVLPNYETLPKTSDIKAKVNSHNSNYQPCRPKSASAIARRTDYSHVKSKVDTGKRNSVEFVKGTPDSGENDDDEKHSNYKSSPLRRAPTSSPSLFKYKPVTRPFRSVSTSQLPLNDTTHAKSGRKYSDVRSRIGSLDNIHHKPGGRTKLAWTEKSSEIENKESSKVSLACKDVPRTPGGSTSKVVNYQTKHFSAQAKSKVDQKDPNPAHKLSHSLKELTLPQGRKVNIRFAERRVKPDSGILSRRFSSADIYCGSKEVKKVPLKKLRKSATEGELRYSQQLVQDGVSCPPEISDSAPSQEMETYGNTSTQTFIGNGYTTSPPSSVSKFSNSHLIQDKQSPPREQTNAITTEEGTFSSVESQSTNIPTENDVHTLFTVFDWQNDSRQVIEEDMEVDDVEVTNTGSETTVILNNIFSKSSLSKEPKEDSITPSPQISKSATQNRDDSEEYYYEVEDSEEEEEEEAVMMYSFPNGIPKVIVTDEMDFIVEVIVDPPSFSWDVAEPEMIQSKLNGSEIDDVNLNMSDLVLSSLVGKVWGDGVSGDSVSGDVDHSFSIYTDREESTRSTRL